MLPGLSSAFQEHWYHVEMKSRWGSWTLPIELSSSSKTKGCSCCQCPFCCHSWNCHSKLFRIWQYFMFRDKHSCGFSSSSLSEFKVVGKHSLIYDVRMPSQLVGLTCILASRDAPRDETNHWYFKFKWFWICESIENFCFFVSVILCDHSWIVETPSTLEIKIASLLSLLIIAGVNS
jgi:hypothetical protein